MLMAISRERFLRRRDASPNAAGTAHILVACALLLLGGCLPGVGDDNASRSSFSETSPESPTLNRSYKTSFMPLKMPSFGAATVESQAVPESGPASLATAAPQAVVANAPAPVPAAKALQSFYSALAALSAGKRSQPVSIVHFGGDQIADDRFAGSLREHLTSRFGNAGRGLMQPGLYPIRGMKVDRGGQWTLASAAGDAPGPFGITGVRVTSAASDAWLRFTSVDGAFDWVEVTLLTGPEQGTASISVDGEVKLVPTRAPLATETSIRVSVKARELMIRPKGDGAITLLSVASGTAAPGIVYSNAGLPGATAWTSEKWNADFAANDFRRLNPDLIVFEYGTKEGFSDGLDVKQYGARLKLALDQLKSWAPHASILVIGPPDAARLPSFVSSGGGHVCRSLTPQEIAAYTQMVDRKDERLARWHAPPLLDAVRAALKRQAAESGAFFWDWAKYMGGSCAIHAWTSLKPALAAPDHLTLTEAGEERSARAVFAELMAGFESYQRDSQAKAQASAASGFTPVLEPTKVSTKKRH